MFCHLHVHTEYSLLDGMCRIPQLIARAKQLGMKSLALTDHGVMYGAVQFYLAAKEAGIKPIIGCEVYVAQGNRMDRNTAKDTDHLILLAKDYTGYHNLVQLITKANLESFYYKPRLDKALLREYSQGLIALSACIGGEIPRLILGGRMQEAREAALQYKDIFEDFYLEIMRHPIPEVERVNQGLIEISREKGLPLVATNDTHYIHQEDAATHDLLLCIGTNTTVQEEKRIKMAGDFYYLKSPDEMAELYKDIPEAIENTGKIADLCNLELEFGRLHLPQIQIPDNKTPDEFLSDLCTEGLPKQYPNPTPEIKERLAYELDVIKQTQFANYFLNVWDIVSFVRKNKIMFGVRGSAAASIVLHCLGITEVDPIAGKLVFERFLNVERKEMPDIDLDFQDDRRDEVIKYVTDKYGQDHVAQIITFGTLGARAALRDVGRALGMAYGDVDLVAKQVPQSPTMTLERALAESKELKEMYEQDSAIKKLVDSARKVEGIVRHASTHAAGIVIAKDPLTRNVPLQRTSKGNGGEESAMTQFVMEDIARVGLLKMDFLGLANLTILCRAKEIIQQTRGLDIDIYNLPMNDPKVFKLLSDGETAGVFQLEGSGMRRYIKNLKPDNFNDIAAMVALYRPGPMEHIPTYIKRKSGEEPINYPHPVLAEFLQDTYGIIVYQDQVLFIVRAFAGYSLGQADIFRKAMGKKIAEVMKKEKQNFMNGAKKNGYSAEIAEQIYALIEPFAGYAFNKAHAWSYALIAYQTAYLKANFTAEYMTALLVSHAGDQEKVTNAVTECRRLGIAVQLPDVNRSKVSFTIEEQSDKTQGIRFGLATIKNVGAGAIEPIIAEREKNGAFKSVEDFCRRVDLRGINRRVMESLVKAGAFDSLSSRGGLFLNIDRILSLAQQEQKRRESGQSTMFDMLGDSMPVPLPSLDLREEEVSVREKSAWEKELLGVSLSRQAFINHRSPGKTRLGELDAEMNGQVVSVIGEVTAVSTSFTRRNETFATVTLEDGTGSIEMMVWPEAYKRTKELWQEGNLVDVRGKVRDREERVQLMCDAATAYQQQVLTEPANGKMNGVPPEPKQRLILDIKQTADKEADLSRVDKIVQTLKEFPGQDEIVFKVHNGDGIAKTLLLPTVFVGYTPELGAKLKELLGEEAFRQETNNKAEH